MSNYKVSVLFSGYSSLNEAQTEMKANCSCTLIKGRNNVIIDTMTAWDREQILKGLREHAVEADDISYVISTHGHSDHIGNNNLFLRAKHIVGYSVSYGETYYLHPFDKGLPYVIDDYLSVIPTPGHTLSDVTVIVKTENQGMWGIAGDLFECAEDIDDASQWLNAGSEAPTLQRQNRLSVAKMVDWIIPGHGKQFPVTKEIIKKLESQIHE